MGTSPILYRYIDWTITVPLQMIEFYLILSAVSNKITQGSFWKLLIGTVVMLVFGYTGEAHLCPGGAWVGFAGGMCGWFLHPLRDLRWRGRICCWRAWISQQVHPGLVRHHASHCHCRLVYLPSWLLLWLPHGWCQ